MSANEPAFPIFDNYGCPNFNKVTETYTEGLTKREYFAAMALNGLTSNLTDWVSEEFFSKYAEQAFSFADAMIEESEKRK